MSIKQNVVKHTQHIRRSILFVCMVQKYMSYDEMCYYSINIRTEYHTNTWWAHSHSLTDWLAIRH